MPFRADGRLTVGDGLAAMDEANFDLAGAPATGALAFRLTPIARIDIALSATRFDLDPWVAALLPAEGGGLSQARLPVGLDLAVDAARLGGGTLQHLRARADAAGGVVRLSDVAAILPGDARLQLDGAVADDTAGEKLLTGSLRLDAPSLRTTLRWLTGSGLVRLPMPPGPVLRTATIAADLRASRTGFALEALTGRIDGAATAGSLRLDGGAHPAVAIDIATDRLAIDPWLEIEPWPPSAQQGGDGPILPVRWLAQGGIATLLGGGGARVAVRAESATLRGMTINGLVLDAAAAADGRLTLRQLTGSAQGLHLDAALTLHPDGRMEGGHLALDGPSAVPLAALAPAGFATPALWQRPVALQLRADGPPGAMALGLGLDLGDTRLEAQPVVNLLAGGWQGPATLRCPDAQRLLTQLGLLPAPARPGGGDWPGEGSLSIIGQFAQPPGATDWRTLSADSIALTAGTLRASGRLAIASRHVDGSIAADILPLPWPDATSQAPLPLAALQGWRGTVQLTAAQVVLGNAQLLDQAAATIRLNEDGIALDDVTGHLGRGALAGQAALRLTGSPPALTARATVRGATISDTDNAAAVGCCRAGSTRRSTCGPAATARRPCWRRCPASCTPPPMTAPWPASTCSAPCMRWVPPTAMRAASPNAPCATRCKAAPPASTASRWTARPSTGC